MRKLYNQFTPSKNCTETKYYSMENTRTLQLCFVQILEISLLMSRKRYRYKPNLLRWTMHTNFPLRIAKKKNTQKTHKIKQNMFCVVWWRNKSWTRQWLAIRPELLEDGDAGLRRTRVRSWQLLDDEMDELDWTGLQRLSLAWGTALDPPMCSGRPDTSHLC